MMVVVSYLLLLLLLQHFPAAKSSVFVSTNPTAWQEARSTCNLANKATVCDTSGGDCQIRLTGNDVLFTDNSPIWIDSYLLRTHFIYNSGCRSADINLFNTETVHYKIGPTNDVNECAVKCGDVTGYALYDYNCFCVNSTTEGYMQEVSYDMCNIDCREGSYEKCGGTPSSTHYHLTYYKVFTTTGNVESSCFAVHWEKDFRINFTFKNCKDKHGFGCVFPSSSEPTFYNFDNSTWDEAKEYCYNNNGRISDDIIVDAASHDGLQTRKYYWSAYHRRYIYKWNTSLHTNQFGLLGCLALNSSFSLELHDCQSQLRALCINETTKTTFDNFSSTKQPTTTFERITFDKTFTSETKSSTVQYSTTDNSASSTITNDVISSILSVTSGRLSTTRNISTTMLVDTLVPRTTNFVPSSGSSKGKVTFTAPSATPIGETTISIIIPSPSVGQLTYTQSSLVIIIVPVVVILLLFLVLILVISLKRYRRYRRRQFLRLYSITDDSSLLRNEMFQDLHNEEYTYLPRLEPRVDFVRTQGDSYDHIRMFRERPKSSRTIQNNNLSQVAVSFNTVQVHSGNDNVAGDLNKDDDNIIRKDLLLLDLNHIRYKTSRSDSLTNYLPVGTGEEKNSVEVMGQDLKFGFQNPVSDHLDLNDENPYFFEFGPTNKPSSGRILRSDQPKQRSEEISESMSDSLSENSTADNKSGNLQTSVTATVHQSPSELSE